MKTGTVKTSHAASYIDPIVVLKAEPLKLTGREDLWDGHLWLWAVAEDGREGWVPDDLVKVSCAGHFASRDYSAIELSCEVGELLTVSDRSHGWAWCKNSSDQQGWVPLNNLRWN